MTADTNTLYLLTDGEGFIHQPYSFRDIIYVDELPEAIRTVREDNNDPHTLILVYKIERDLKMEAKLRTWGSL